MVNRQGWTALYRHFDDEGALLYVGVSLHPIARMEQHGDAAGWFQFITRVEIEWHASRDAALAAEAQAITGERPLFNVKLSDPAVLRAAEIAAARRADESARELREMPAPLAPPDPEAFVAALFREHLSPTFTGSERK